MTTRKSTSAPAAFDELCRRAGGRRRYNFLRKQAKFARRAEIFSRLANLPRVSLSTRGLQPALAKALGVSRRTICRDIWAIRHALEGALLD
jgi:hypothetical protein